MEARRRAGALLVVFGLAVILSVLLFVLVEPNVQTIGPAELVARRSDAVAYFTLDYLFVVVYGMAGPFVLWRFGRTVGPRNGESSRTPSWVAVGVVALVAGGIFDAIENALLLAVSSKLNEGLVDAAHLLAIPKYAFGGVGLILSVRAVAAAVRVLRAPAA